MTEKLIDSLIIDMQSSADCGPGGCTSGST